RMNQGLSQEALRLFDLAIEKAPGLSRAHNNRAALLIRMGADIGDLLVPFGTALATSETTEDFGRHLINLCLVAAYGADHGAPEVLALIGNVARQVIKDQCPEELRPQLFDYVSTLIAGFCHIAAFRSALAQRRWNDAAAAIRSAKSTFVGASLSALATGLDDAARYLEVARRIFAFVEEFAAGSFLDPSSALIKAVELHQAAAALRKENPDSLLYQLLDVLGWFLALLLHQLEFLIPGEDSYHRIDDDLQVMIWLSTTAYRRLGDDLVGLISAGDRLCQNTSNALQTVASQEASAQLKVQTWMQIAILARSRLFDFQGVDVDLGRAVLKCPMDPIVRIRTELDDFRLFVERQAYRDIFVGTEPQENIARALLQARLRGRTYREVPVRGGRTDILAFSGSEGERVIIETKIWRGPEYHEQGIRELEEYIRGESDDGRLLGPFYVVFDPTDSARAAAYEGSSISTRALADVRTDILAIRLRPPTPSRAHNEIT